MPYVTIITINYNNSALTYGFLNSLQKFFPKAFTYEVIVVDNASDDIPFSEFQQKIDNIGIPVKLVRSNINLGFGGGNMLGNQFANGKYLAFINNDIIFTEDCFTSLIDFMQNNDEVGVCSPQQLNSKGEPTVGFDYFQGIRKELFGRFFIELFMGKSEVKRMDYPYQQNSEVDWIQGCFMFFDSCKFASIGGFDTNLFLYFEEMDVCYRLKKLGYTSYLIPKSSFIHLQGASIGKSFVMKQELLLSRIYVYRKNYSFAKYKFLQILIVFKLFLKAFFSKNRFLLFYKAFTGMHLKHSLKQKQQIKY